MVGGGIFAVLGVAAKQAGGATPFAFLLAGAIAALTGYSYSKLSVAHPSAGGTVTFVDRAFGVNEVTGSLNVVLWAGYVATTALYASAFGNYAATLFPGGTDPSPLLLRSLIVAGIAIPWLINLVSAEFVARSETAIVAIKLAILALVIVAASPSIESSRLGLDTWPSPFAAIAAGMLIFVAYEGFELIANASEDAKKPRRTLPRAFAASIGIVVVLYVAISFVVVGSLSPSEIAASADYALAQAASTTLGQVGFTIVAISAILATLSAINATLYGAARLSFTIATEGELPEPTARRVWNQPIGLFITAGLAMVLAVGLPLSSISGLASAIFLIVFATVNVAALRSPRDIGTRRIIAGAGAAGCLLSLVVLVTSLVSDDLTSVLALVIIVGAVLAAEHLILKRRRPATRL